MKPIVFSLLVVAALSARPAQAISPQDSANMDATRDTPSKSGFLVDPNRAFPMLFTPADNTHTSPAGAELNAQSVVEGLKLLKDVPLAVYVKPKAPKNRY
jgi:hypothetical protein